MKNNKQQTVQELLAEIRKLSGKSNNSQLIAKLRKASETSDTTSDELIELMQKFKEDPDTLWG
jgi:hypothetical protein